MRRITLLLFCLMTFFACRTAQPLHTIEQLDVKKYCGTWYEIARFTHRFEKGLECVSATYTLLPNGKIEVLNQGRKASNWSQIKKAKGIAWIPNPQRQGQLKVQFFWPFKGNYWIIELDPDYHCALIGDASRNYLWILSRNKTLDISAYNRLVKIASRDGFDIRKLDKVRQDCPF